jgi:hypothetical protein
VQQISFNPHVCTPHNLWFCDAKFGIWSHWGPQPVPGEGAWYARHRYDPKHANYWFHTNTYGHPSPFGYKDLLPLFKPEKFDAGAPLEIFKRAGVGGNPETFAALPRLATFPTAGCAACVTLPADDSSLFHRADAVYPTSE